MNRPTRLRTLDGFRIAAVHTQGTRSDAVIWMHGISVDKDEHLGFFRDGAQYIARAGFGSIRFDFRGHGQSSGTSLDFSIVGQNLDVMSVVNFAQKKYGRDLRLHVVGASFGAPPAIFAAARYPDLIQTVTLVAPVLSYWRTFLRPETEWAAQIFSGNKLQSLEKRGRLYFDANFCVGLSLLEEMRIVRPDVILRELRQPILVFHGNRDSMVPYDATVDACRGLRGVTLVTMDGTDHGFTIEGDDDGNTQESAQNKSAMYRRLTEHLKC